MRPEIKLRFAVGVLALAIAASIAWRAAHTRRSAEETLAMLATQKDALAAEVRSAQENLKIAQQARAARLHEMEKLRQAKSVTSADSPAKKETRPARKPVSMSDLIADDPKAEALMIEWQRKVALLEYGPFFSTHGISPEQVRKYQDSVVRRVEEDIDLRATARLDNGPSEQELAALQQQSKDRYEAAKAEILGADNYREYQEFQKTLGAKNIIVRGFAGAAALEGIPLTGQQGQQLLQAAIDSGHVPERVPAGKDLLEFVDWDVLNRSASEILTPAQYELFRNSSAPTGFQSRWQYALNAAVRRAHEADAAASAEKKTER